MPARPKKNVELRARVPLANLIAWLAGYRGLDPATAPAIGGLLAFYAKRVEEHPIDAKLRAALIAYLDATTTRVPAPLADGLKFYPEEIDLAENLALRLQLRLGDAWMTHHLGPGQALTVRREDGTAKRNGRGLTDHMMFKTLGTLIIRTSKASDHEALSVWLPLLDILGYGVTLNPGSVVPLVSRTRTAIKELFADYHMRTTDLDPRSALAAYAELARTLGDDYQVRVPRELPPKTGSI